LYGTFGANEDLKPQKSNSFEVGLEYSHPDDFVSGSVNYFKRKIKDIIVYEFTPGYLNRDEQNDGGLEVLVRLNFSKKVTLEGFYNYVDGELTTLDDSGEETEISNLIRRPKHRFSLLAKLQPVENLFVSIQGQYIGDRNDHFYNPANFYAREEVDLNPYFLLNAYAEYGFLAGKLTVFADLKNITDTDFTEVYGYNTIGFNVNAGFRFRW